MLQLHVFTLLGTSSPLSELRVVLLGFKDAGKSSSGNTILGREEFQPGQRSAVCVKRQGDVAGRQVTVVEAPGWWSCYSKELSPEMTKRAIQLSPGLCGQGPHVFLLITRADILFTEAQMISARQHLELLSERVWRYTILLFTHGDWLGDTPIEQYIESEGDALKWLTEKCGNRYHVLNNHNSTDGRQVTELLEKIEDMVAGNGSSHFKMDKGLLRDLEEREKIERSRAEERMMKVKQHRHGLRSTQGQIHQSSLRIILLGSKNYGKSSTGNTILGEDVFELCTISKCEKREGEVAGRQLTVVDTPGWELHSMDNPPVFLKQETSMSVSLCDPGPHVFLLIVALDTAVTSQVILQLQKYLTLFSEAIWSHTMVLFDFGDWLGDTLIEQHIESEGRDLCWLIEQCGNRYHVFNNEKKDDKDQVTELLAKIEEMLAGNSGHHYETDRNRLEEVKERREKEEERATERLMKVKRQRKHLQSLKREFLGQCEPAKRVRTLLHATRVLYYTTADVDLGDVDVLSLHAPRSTIDDVSGDGLLDELHSDMVEPTDESTVPGEVPVGALMSRVLSATKILGFQAPMPDMASLGGVWEGVSHSSPQRCCGRHGVSRYSAPNSIQVAVSWQRLPIRPTQG
ncbi:GTPase IMAP family member 8-like [Alosa pseudoharengus]|uniref:GTPase IMAP family member 8-like n=1 Tax=Alosa pseudoharengus TaxID=34774 RepID=UPI003F8B2D1E